MKNINANRFGSRYSSAPQTELNIDALVTQASNNETEHHAEASDKSVAEDHSNRAFIPKVFAHSLIPYRASEERIATTSIQRWRYDLISGSLGLPHGRYPRLALAFITTQAFYNKKRWEQGKITKKEALRIPLGESNRTLFKGMGLSHDKGGKAARAIQMQIVKLAAAKLQKVSITQNVNFIDYESEPTVDVALRAKIFAIEESKRRQSNTSFINLSEEFFDLITDLPIPINMDILSNLQSPRAMDLYCWILVKRYWIKKSGYDFFSFDWDSVAFTFANKESLTPRQLVDFRKEIRKCLTQINEAWPDMGVSVEAKGITVFNGELALPLGN